MSISQSFRLALKSLLTSKMRSLLTMLGIIIGVGAVIVITSLGNGMQRMMNDQFEQLGANLIQVMIWADGSGSRTVRPDDMYQLVEKNPEYLDGVSPYLTPKAPVRRGSDEFNRTRLFGVSEYFYDPARNQTMQGEHLAQGRYLSYVDVERREHVCVIGEYLNRIAFRGDALGQTISIQGIPYTVVGVLDEYADGTEGSRDDVIYLPYGCAMELGTSGSLVNYYLFNSHTKDGAAAAKGVIERRLYQTFQDNSVYMTMSSAEMMDAMNTMMDTMMVVLVAIAAISLLVGGIGIMNIMLVSVTERTREIGIRKSLGAKRRDIRGQFIIEAATTSAIGGVMGILAGMGLAGVAGKLIEGVMASSMGTTVPFNTTPTAGSALVAFGVSVAIGVLFGFLPADKAAKLNPIDALRYD